MALHRRRVGVSRGVRGDRVSQSWSTLGAGLEKEQLEQMQKQMKIFKTNLEEFAKKYKKDINKDPAFRKQFQDMCTSIGVDPLASNKGFWADLLGMGDFYYKLAVQIVEVCLRTRDTNGGLIEMKDMQRHLRRMRGRHTDKVSSDDIERAIKTMKILGDVYKVVKVGKKRMILSVASELSADDTTILTLAQEKYFVTGSLVRSKLSWEPVRIRAVLGRLLKQGIAWVDDQGVEKEYWFPSLIPNTVQ